MRDSLVVARAAYCCLHALCPPTGFGGSVEWVKLIKIFSVEMSGVAYLKYSEYKKTDYYLFHYKVGNSLFI